MPIGKHKPQIILGIDPGLADTGYGVIKVENQRLTALAYGSIKTKPSCGLAERLLALERELQKIINQFKPRETAVEELFFCNNVKTALSVGQARGVVLLTLRKNGLPITEFTPLQVKQAVSGYGQADKRQVQKMVQTILKLKELPRPDDAADALAVAISASNQLLPN
jgi:crossover junction endodeoxyribonuclease RuvC